MLAQTDDEVGGFVSVEELERAYETYRTTETLAPVAAAPLTPAKAAAGM